MSLKQQIISDLTAAMKAKEADKLTVLRSIKTEIQKAEIALRKGDTNDLSDQATLDVLTKAAKQRKDSIEQFEAAKREDLASKERFELEIIQSYLPKQLSEEEITTLVKEVIQTTGASAPSDMGKVMGALMPKVKGKADGGLVNKIVRELLNN
jgi:uncharacterized protein YqeY